MMIPLSAALAGEDLPRSAPPAAAPPPGALYQMVSPALIFDFLHQARVMICLPALLASLTALVWLWFLATPLYRASATVMMETAALNPSEDPMFLSPYLGTPAEISSQIEILRSNTLLQQLARDQGLREDPEFSTPPWRWPWQAPPPESSDYQDQLLVTALRERLYLRNIPGSLVFEVSLASNDPQKSLRLTNALAEAYIGFQVSLRQQSARDAALWLSSRTSALREGLIRAELEAARFRAASSFRGIEALNLTEQQIKDLRQRLSPGQIPEGEDSRRAALQRSLSGLEAGLEDQISDFITLQQLDREAEARRDLYQHFLGEWQKNAAREGLQSPGSRVLARAILPPDPFSPRYKLVLVLAALSGAAAGAGFAWLRLTGARGFASPGAAEAFSGLPVLGDLPLVPGAAGAQSALSLISPADGPDAAHLRNLRAGIELALPAAAHRPVILCTAAQNGEGTSFTAEALALHLAALGQKVLLITVDPRRPPEGRSLRLRPGDALAQDALLRQMIRRPPGHSPARLDAAGISGLSRDSWTPAIFGMLIAFAQREFEVILLDTPPVLPVRETLRMLSFCDLALLMVEWRRSDRRHLAECLSLIARHHGGAQGGAQGGPALGLVMTRMPRRTAGKSTLARLFSSRDRQGGQRRKSPSAA